LTRILIVDAYSHSREGLRVSLLGGGCHVETAAGCWEAIKKIKDGGFRVAVLDANLPPAQGVAMTGWDLARILRAFNPALAIVVVTAESGPEVNAQAERLGVSRLLEKPINPRELRTLVQTLGAEATALAETQEGRR
jgi:CheY-like chemotaxis protein